MTERWQNQEEALAFALGRPACMLDMDMGTGKTRTAIDVVFAREDVHTVLVVCPKAVIPVWRRNLEKFAPVGEWSCWDRVTGTISKKTEDLEDFCRSNKPDSKCFVVINYDSVWRNPIGDYIYKKAAFDMVILDESHRAKSAGSKVSKYLAMLGKKTRYRLCLSGTPMANSPLDVYGQYRFLDPTIFGTRHDRFLQEYAIMGGPEMNFIVGFKNQSRLQQKFASIAYTCKMSDVRDRLKLPPELPSVVRYVTLPSADMKTMRELNREFVAECNRGSIVARNVLVKMLRLQQITSGFCEVTESIMSPSVTTELNTAKADSLADLLEDMSPEASLVVFCVFVHDLDTVQDVSRKAKRSTFELSGRVNQLEQWQREGGVLAVQIQAGAEGVDMTRAHHAVYFSLPHSMALYAQSRARLYRPGQTNQVSFIHMVASGTIDETIYGSLVRKRNLIDAIKAGEIDFGMLH